MAISKKDDIIEELKEELQILTIRSQRTTELLENQRRDLMDLHGGPEDSIIR